MSCRPEGWDNTASVGDDPLVAFEAGADAILAALRKGGWHYNAAQISLPSGEMNVTPGVFVFIPDDVKES